MTLERDLEALARARKQTVEQMMASVCAIPLEEEDESDWDDDDDHEDGAAGNHESWEADALLYAGVAGLADQEEPSEPTLAWQDVLAVIDRLPSLESLKHGSTSAIHARLASNTYLQLIAFTCDVVAHARCVLAMLLFNGEDFDFDRIVPFALVELGGQSVFLLYDDWEAAVLDKGTGEEQPYVYRIFDATLESAIGVAEA